MSEADLAAEALIRGRLARERPGDGVVGEEGDDEVGSSGRRWIVDPLDGTVNFLYGIPQWCVSIALEGEVGVVYDAMRDECWAVRVGESPTCNGAVVSSSGCESFDRALIATGFGYDGAVREVQGALVARLLPRVRDIRRFGSAALDLAWTAAGRHDAYFERGTKLWDVAAGSLLCAAAGLEVHDLPAMPPSETGILVAPAAFAQELLDAVVDV